MDFKLNQLSIILMVICGALIVLIIMVCEHKSVKLNVKNVKSIKSISKLTPIVKDDNVMIFHADWCGHCQKSMDDFKKASEESNGKVLMFNSDDPSSKPLIEKYNVKSYPTIMKGSGEQFNGQRTKDEILNFAKS